MTYRHRYQKRPPSRATSLKRPTFAQSEAISPFRSFRLLLLNYNNETEEICILYRLWFFLPLSPITDLGSFRHREL